MKGGERVLTLNSLDAILSLCIRSAVTPDLPKSLYLNYFKGTSNLQNITIHGTRLRKDEMADSVPQRQMETSVGCIEVQEAHWIVEREDWL